MRVRNYIIDEPLKYPQLIDVVTSSPAPEAVSKKKTFGNKKEKNMHLNFDDCDCEVTTDLARTQQYFVSRTNDAYYAKNLEAEKFFGLKDDDRPKTPKELVERIKGGKYMIHKDREDTDSWTPVDYIHWRDPEMKENAEGFKAFEKVLLKKKIETKDTVMASDALAMKKAIEELEALPIQ